MRKRLLTCLVLIIAISTISAQKTWIQTSKDVNQVSPTLQLEKSPLSKSALNEIISTKADNAISKIKLADNQTLLGYGSEDDGIYALGLGEKCTLSCGVFFPKELITKYKDNKIKSIRFAMASSNYITNFSVWITKKLGGTPIVKQNVESVQKGWNDIELSEPYDIDGSEIYIGYSFVLSAVVEPQTDGYPIAVKAGDTPNGLFLSANLIENGTWYDYYGSGNGTLLIQALVEGDNIIKNDVSFDDVTYDRALTNQEYEISGLLTNYGKNEVSSIDVSYELGGVSKQVNVPFTTPVSSFGRTVFPIKITTPANDGRYDVKIKIEKVNGVIDENLNDNEKTTTMICMEESFPRKTVVEEGTGVGCGWCPRGIVGMEKLKEKYPDTFIGIAIHWDVVVADPMKVSDFLPIIQAMGGGFPSCIVNRSLVADPYHGNDSQEFGIDKVFDLAQATPCEASVSLSTAYADDKKTKVNVTSQVVFNYSCENVPYKIAYVVVEDGVTGAKQTNYYNESFYSQNVGNPSTIPADLEKFKKSPYTITNLAFNDVAVGIYDCLGIEGSLSGTIEKNKAKLHTHTITLPAKVQNKDNVRIVALLLDAVTGEIVNAQQVRIGEATGNKEIKDNGFSATVEVSNALLTVTTTENAVADLYSVDGTKVATATINGSATIPVAGLKGTYIVRVNNGNDVVVRKIIL